MEISAGVLIGDSNRNANLNCQNFDADPMMLSDEHVVDDFDALDFDSSGDSGLGDPTTSVPLLSDNVASLDIGSDRGMARSSSDNVQVFEGDNVRKESVSDHVGNAVEITNVSETHDFPNLLPLTILRGNYIGDSPNTDACAGICNAELLANHNDCKEYKEATYEKFGSVAHHSSVPDDLTGQDGWVSSSVSETNWFNEICKDMLLSGSTNLPFADDFSRMQEHTLIINDNNIEKQLCYVGNSEAISSHNHETKGEQGVAFGCSFAMNRRFGGLPLLRRLLHLNNPIVLPIPVPIAPPIAISKPAIPVPKILTRHFSSKIVHEELSQQQNPFFPSLKCYTRDDPDTPYYVIESFPLLQKEANEGKTGCSLPEEMQLSCNIVHINCETCDLYLVGVNSNGDQVIFLELCASRSAALQKLQNDSKNQAQNRVFPVAFEKAIKNGAKVVLGDRPFHITVKQILEGMLAMRPWEFTKLSFYLLFRFIEYGKDNKTFDINDFILKKLEDLKTFSTLKQPAILERDLYMSSVLTKVADEHSLVVAFIGSDHVSGIKKHLQRTFAINLSEEIPGLDEVPASK